jgi:XTP/dITP diphosphohydrolase
VKVLVGTSNPGKLRELEVLLDGLGMELVGLGAFPDAPDVIEDRDTFEGNAIKKARELAAFSGLPTFADDSGLEVDALGGAPGVLSARYAGRHGDDAANNAKLMAELEGVPRAARTARFRCVLAFVDPARGIEETAEGTVEGRIVEGPPRGANGFGYDPLFELLDRPVTTAELAPEDKNAISHRAKAARSMAAALAR